MEKDFSDRVKDFAHEFLNDPALLEEITAVALIQLLTKLADKHNIIIKQKDLGEQEIQAHERAWKRYQVWLDDPDSFEGGLYGQSEDSIEQAYLLVPQTLQVKASIRETNFFSPMPELPSHVKSLVDRFGKEINIQIDRDRKTVTVSRQQCNAHKHSTGIFIHLEEIEYYNHWHVLYKEDLKRNSE